MKYTWIAIALFALAFMPAQQKKKIFLVGDSTMANKSITAYPETGWGMIFSKFFDTTKAVVFNEAQNGRSTRSFIEENRWAPIVNQLQEGDIVLIQFGHNDEVPTKKTATTPDEFQKYLAQYVDETRSKKAIPVLITPVARRKFDKEGKVVDTHTEYAALVRKVAAQKNVPLVELDRKSQELLQQMGPANAALLYNHLTPGEHPNYPEGKMDDTHFSELGARKMAEIVYGEIKTLNPGNINDYFFKPVVKTKTETK